MNTPDKETLVTVAFVAHNDEDIIEKSIKEIRDVLQSRWSFYEILVLDNGSTDQTVLKIQELQNDIPNIRLLVLSKEYDHNIAISAALENSIGDYVIIKNIEYDPPALIHNLMDKISEDIDVVIAERNDRDENNPIQNFFARLFYSIISKISGVQFSPNASEFRVLSRRAVNSITTIRSKTRYIKYTNMLVGFKHIHIPYDRKYRRTLPKKNMPFLKSVLLAIEVIVSNSVAPLRLASLLGIAASGVNFLIIIYVFVITIIKQEITEGWISTSLINSTMFLILFIIIAVLAEYIGRILMESKDQPLYFVAEEFNSDFVKDMKDTINVV